MNLRKHVAGLALFLVIFGSAVFINAYLTAPIGQVPPVPVVAPMLPQLTMSRPQPISFKVRQVSLDFINFESHTTLALKREDGQPVPEKLWVTTVFFAPDYARGRGWTSEAEIRRPFASDDRIEVTATGECGWCEVSDMPKAGYFARVYVSTEYAGKSSYPADIQFNRDITDAEPVVVHWPDEIKAGRR